MAIKLTIINATYISGYKLEIIYSNGLKNIVDFEEFLYSADHKLINKYRKITAFKRFKIENGNLVWGHDWDLIFPIKDLFKGQIGLFKNIIEKQV